MSAAIAVVVGLLAAPPLAALSLHALRNALLARRLPAIRERLRAWFGPGADVSSARLDSRWRLHATGVRVPIAGGRLVVLGERVELGGVPGLLRGQGVDALWLEALEGTLEVPGKEGEPPRLRAPLSFRTNEAREPDFPICGKLRSRGAAWTHRRKEIGSPPAFDLDATIKIGARSWALEDARASCEGATLEGKLLGAIGGSAPPPALDVSAKVEKVSAALLAHVLALAETDLLVTLETPELASLPGLRLPKELAVSGEIGLSPDSSRRAKLALATPSSQLLLDAKVDPAGLLEGSTLTGKLSFHDAETCRIFPSDLRPTRKGEMQVEARLEGSLSHPILAGKSTTQAVELAWASRPEQPSFPFREASVLVRLERERLAWSKLEAKGFGGRFFGDGIFHLDTTPVSRTTHVGFENVRVDEIPTAPGKPAIATVFAARASGEIRGRGQGPSLEQSNAEGTLRLDEPDYRFIAWSAASLGAFGLPTPPSRGLGPCRSRVVIARGKVELADIEGAVAGVTWRGNVASTWAGQLQGSLDVELDQSFLGKSLLLALPSAFTGNVRVPITIAGQLGRPELEADVIGALSGLLQKDPIRVIETAAVGLGSVVEGVMGGLFGIFDDGPSRPRRTKRERKEPSDLDRVLDRILEGGEEAGRLRAELISKGVSPGELEDLLRDRRRGRRTEW